MNQRVGEAFNNMKRLAVNHCAEGEKNKKTKQKNELVRVSNHSQCGPLIA